jgi:hypothetical protein
MDTRPAKFLVVLRSPDDRCYSRDPAVCAERILAKVRDKLDELRVQLDTMALAFVPLLLKLAIDEFDRDAQLALASS